MTSGRRQPPDRQGGGWSDMYRGLASGLVYDGKWVKISQWEKQAVGGVFWAAL